MLSGLKNMALDMGETIESQNTQIDRITDKAQQNELRLDAANQRSENILHGKKKKKWSCQKIGFSIFGVNKFAHSLTTLLHNGFSVFSTHLLTIADRPLGKVLT